MQGRKQELADALKDVEILKWRETEKVRKLNVEVNRITGEVLSDYFVVS